MPEYLSKLTDWHTYQLIPAYPSGLTDWPIYLSIWNYWPTNIPDYPAWLTDQHTRPSIWADWLTNIPDHLRLLKFVYYQCVVSCLPVHPYYPPSYKDWLTSAFLFYLLMVISAYLSGLTDWPTSCYLRIYIWADCLSVRLTIMPVFLSCIPVWVNYRHTYMPTCLNWLHFCLHFLPYISRLTNWPTYLSTSLGWLLPNLPIGADWPTDIPVYLSGLTRIKKNMPAYHSDWLFCLLILPTYLGWLTKQNSCISWPTD